MNTHYPERDYAGVVCARIFNSGHITLRSVVGFATREKTALLSEQDGAVSLRMGGNHELQMFHVFLGDFLRRIERSDLTQTEVFRVHVEISPLSDERVWRHGDVIHSSSTGDKKILMTLEHISGPYLANRESVSRDFQDLFQDCPFQLAPTVPYPPEYHWATHPGLFPDQIAVMDFLSTPEPKAPLRVQ